MKQGSMRTINETNTEAFLQRRQKNKKNRVKNGTCWLLFGSDHVTFGNIKHFLSAELSPWIWGYNMAFVVMQH